MQYIEWNMALLSLAEIQKIERDHLRGVSSATIVSVFKKKGERFSAATLRKYVQVGLLPKSKRVGTRGRYRGSSGLYPVSVIRQINEIKRALDQGATLDEIRLGSVGLVGQVEVLERASQQAYRRFEEAVAVSSPAKRRAMLKKNLDKHIKVIQKEIKALERFADRLGLPRLDEQSGGWG